MFCYLIYKNNYLALKTKLAGLIFEIGNLGISFFIFHNFPLVNLHFQGIFGVVNYFRSLIVKATKIQDLRLKMSTQQKRD